MDPTSAYPAGLDSFEATPVELDGPDPTHQEMHEKAQNAIVNMQTEFGTAPSGSFSTVRARFEAVESDVGAWPPAEFGAGVDIAEASVMLLDRTPIDSGDVAFAWAAGWTGGFSRVRKYGALGEGGVVEVSVGMTRTGSAFAGSAATPATLPAGYRPATRRYLQFYVTNPAGTQMAFSDSDGVITFSSLTINTGGEIYLQTAFVIPGV